MATKIVSFFDTEADLDKALNTIYSMDIEGKNVTIVRGENQIDPVPAIVVPLVPPATSGGQFPANQAAATVVASGAFSDLNFGPEERDYYQKVANEGATVVFVTAADEQANAVMDTLKHGGATRVEALR